jgi:vacuolar-type H+-ATPase subunit H
VVLRAAQKANVAADMKKAEEELNKALNEMQQASDEVKKKLEPLDKLDAKGGNKMIELVSLKASRYDKKDKGVPIYVTSDKIKKVLAEKRLYLVESEKAKREKDKIFKDGKLNTKEIKHRIAEGAVQGFQERVEAQAGRCR